MGADQTPLDLEAIRARLDDIDTYLGVGEFLKHAPADLRRLLPEVSRIRAELDEAYRAAGAEQGRAAALEAANREACTARDVRDTEIVRLQAQLRNERERLNEALAENVRRLGEITGLRAKAKQAWSEGHSAALAAGCDSEDQFRANLGVLLVAEEHRCQLAINEEPLNPHLHGKLSGLHRARDIVTGPAALGLNQDGSGNA